ncbi:DUF3592 domain-containing protein [Rapidithrix thailandica]|uniref:DUF3592 domain-containing protein n=1 Tax=Rapidithrix thailandica TaxID=413964 RepID=A0AAW9S9N4_9BACT
MQSLAVNLLVILVFALPGTLFFFLALWEIREEIEFKKNAITTLGKVVGMVPVKYKSQSIEGGHRVGITRTPESKGGYFFRIEFQDQCKDSYVVQPKKVYKKAADSVTVYYSKEDPNDFMVDGFYKEGIQKYYRLVMGSILGILPLFYILYTLLRPIFRS